MEYTSVSNLTENERKIISEHQDLSKEGYAFLVEGNSKFVVCHIFEDLFAGAIYYGEVLDFSKGFYSVYKPGSLETEKFPSFNRLEDLVLKCKEERITLVCVTHPFFTGEAVWDYMCKHYKDGKKIVIH